LNSFATGFSLSSLCRSDTIVILSILSREFCLATSGAFIARGALLVCISTMSGAGDAVGIMVMLGANISLAGFIASVLLNVAEITSVIYIFAKQLYLGTYLNRRFVA
jgi:acyl-CoA synthetase (AMP-forming)/AMP-acid ligase II